MPLLDGEELGMAQLLGAVPSPTGSTELSSASDTDFGGSVLSAAVGTREAPREQPSPELPSTLSGGGNHTDGNLGGITRTLGSCSRSVAPSLCLTLIRHPEVTELCCS